MYSYKMMMMIMFLWNKMYHSFDKYIKQYICF